MPKLAHRIIAATTAALMLTAIAAAQLRHDYKIPALLSYVDPAHFQFDYPYSSDPGVTTVYRSVLPLTIAEACSEIQPPDCAARRPTQREIDDICHALTARQGRQYSEYLDIAGTTGGLLWYFSAQTGHYYAAIELCSPEYDKIRIEVGTSAETLAAARGDAASRYALEVIANTFAFYPDMR